MMMVKRMCPHIHDNRNVTHGPAIVNEFGGAQRYALLFARQRHEIHNGGGVHLD